MTKNILAVVAHPDDEVLGCGGTLARHARRGDKVTVLIFTDGVGSRKPAQDGQEAREREKCARKAATILGVNELVLLDYPDNNLDSAWHLTIVREIESVINKINPAVIYTHHRGDVNIDHRLVHDAVVVACRPHPNHCVEELLFFEIPSSSEWMVGSSRSPFAPNWYVDVADTFALKLRALSAYGIELREFPHPRSLKAIEALAQWRGACAGVEAAEAFELGRRIS